MNREPILIRVDATPRTGYERLARCLILAAALQRRRRTAYFLSQIEPATMGFNLKRGGNEWLVAGNDVGTSDDIGETLREIHRLQPAAILVDDAGISEKYLKKLAGTGILVVSMDHLANIRFPSHLIINPLLGPARESYEFRPGTQVLLGQRYSLVRPEIRRLRPARSQEPAPLPQPNGKVTAGQFRALLALGEDDPNRRLVELAKLLLGVPRLGKIDVVVRPFHPDFENLQALAAANAERLELVSETPDIAHRVVRCHFAITNGSGWSLELACLGVPQLLVVQSEVHWPNAQRMEEEGCATCLGWHENVSAQTIRQAIQNLLTDPLERQGMARCGRKLIDGRGPDRFINALEIMLHRQHLMPAAEAA